MSGDLSNEIIPVFKLQVELSESIKMSLKIVVSFILIGLLSFENVSSQSSSTSTSARPSQPTPDPNSIWAKIKTLHKDAEDMKRTDSIDNAKLLSDLDAVVKAAHDKSITLPSSVESEINDLKKTIRDSPANANTQETLNKIMGVKKEIMHSIKEAHHDHHDHKNSSSSIVSSKN